jgi:hypothetical protein
MASLDVFESNRGRLGEVAALRETFRIRSWARALTFSWSRGADVDSSFSPGVLLDLARNIRGSPKEDALNGSLR